MGKEFVPYHLALKMKALGFDEPCFGYYDSNGEFRTKQDEYELYLICNSKWISPSCSAPTWYQAFRWFDNSTEYSGFIVPSPREGLFTWWIQNYTEPQLSIESEKNYSSREEAELSCLEKLIEIVEEKQK